MNHYKVSLIHYNQRESVDHPLILRTLFLFFVTFAVFAVVNVVTGEDFGVVQVTVFSDKAA